MRFGMKSNMLLLTLVMAFQFTAHAGVKRILVVGADFLALANQTNLAKVPIEERTKLWKGIAKNAETAALRTRSSRDLDKRLQT
jgi:hypothetical protein